MKLLRWCSTIFIFLSAAFTARAQALEALEYERVLYEGAEPARANQALIGRARCLIELERYADAIDALDRIRLFALPAEDAPEVHRLQALARFRSGDWPSAAAYLQEGFPSGVEADMLRVLILAAVHNYTDALQAALAIAPRKRAELESLFAKAPKHKNETTAAMLSLLPPLGHLYLGSGKWPAVTLTSYAGAALAAWQIVEGNYLTAILGGGLLLNASYMEHNIAQMPALTAETNRSATEKFLASLEELLRLECK